MKEVTSPSTSAFSTKATRKTDIEVRRKNAGGRVKAVGVCRT